MIMNEDEVWAAIDIQRLRTVDLLESLSAEEWAHASLCDGWTVRDVAAHLTLQQISLGDGLRMALRHPGSINHINRENARRRAGLPTERLIADIRGMVGSRRHNFGLTHLDTLIDIVIHGQDIAIPLSRELEADPQAAAAAATRVWSDHLTRRGRWKLRVFRSVPYEHYQLTATDTPWSVGEGLEIRGPILAILMVLTGRLVCLPQLSGEGAMALKEWLDQPGSATVRAAE
jgi:uncharacterized protein (TIGR03083 family)